MNKKTKVKMNKKTKAKVKTSISTLVLAAFGGLVTLLVLVVLITVPTRFYFRPEQTAKVEVVDKRIRRYSGGGKSSKVTTYSNIVAFSFPDSSVKELKIDKGSFSSAYDSIHEGDTGILIYKEIKNIDKKYKNNENMRYDGRFFISFERDSKYGELKIESTEQKIGLGYFMTLGALTTMWIFFAVFLVKRAKDAIKYIH